MSRIIIQSVRRWIAWSREFDQPEQGIPLCTDLAGYYAPTNGWNRGHRQMGLGTAVSAEKRGLR